MSTRSCPEEVAVGAYLLGTLEPAERAIVAAHLETCEHCREVRDELAGLPGFLARVSPAEATSGPPQPGEDAYRRLVAAAAGDRRQRNRRRWVVAAAAAAAVVVLLAGSWAVVLVGEDAPRTVSARAGGVRASVTVLEADNGSRLRLRLSGVRSGERCRLVAVGRDGHREVAGSWVATYAGAASITGTSATAPDELESLRIETFDGATLLDLPLDRD